MFYGDDTSIYEVRRALVVFQHRERKNGYAENWQDELEE
jgi:hypothetical protein